MTPEMLATGNEGWIIDPWSVKRTRMEYFWTSAPWWGKTVEGAFAHMMSIDKIIVGPGAIISCSCELWESIEF